MTERTRNIVVGVTALVGLAGMVVLILLFGNLPQWTTSGYPLHVVFPDAGGLGQGSRVRLAGIDIGRVDHIRLREPAHLGVIVEARVERDVDIPQSVRPTILRPLLGSNAVLSLEVSQLTAQQAADILPRDGSVILKGQPSSMLSNVAGTIQETFQGPAEQFEQVVERFGVLSRQWELVGANLNALIEPRQVDAVDQGDQMGNLSTVLARTDRRLAELEQVLAGFARYVSDEQIHEDIRGTIRSAREAAEQAVALTQSANVQMNQLTGRFVAAADDFAAAMQQAQGLLEQARQGQGTIGRFVHDPALYDNLNDAAVRLQATLDEIVLLVQKWKQEGLPIQF